MSGQTALTMTGQTLCDGNEMPHRQTARTEFGLGGVTVTGLCPPYVDGIRRRSTVLPTFNHVFMTREACKDKDHPKGKEL
jgi:hypothetical protein